MIILAKNMNLLRFNFPAAWAKLQQLEKCPTKDLDKVKIEKSTWAETDPNLFVKKNEQEYFMHDLNDPRGEAESIIDQQDTVAESSDILFYGTGLGYHIDVFTQKYPDLIFSIYEPVPEIFIHYLSQVDLEKLPLSSIKNIYIEDKPDYTRQFAYEFVGQMQDAVCIIDFPAYEKMFPAHYNNFFSQFEEAINERSSALNTTSAFEKRWTLNSMLNFDQVLSTPNILLEKAGALRDKPALLVAAGPSLSEEIRNIRYIMDNGLAYVFSVGAAVNTLIDHDIHPHAACTYDPSSKNHIVFRKLVNRNITDIPLIFGSSVGYEVLENYPGPKFHMLTTPDTVSRYYLQAKSQHTLELIHDAPSIAVITLQLLYKLGFNPVILCGLNLAYKDNKQHAEGLDYSNAEISEKQQSEAVKLEDVYGNAILSNPAYMRMKTQLEMFIDVHNDFKVINTTCGGANIEGTVFRKLSEVIKDMLPDKVFDENWLNLKGNNYDLKYLRRNYNKIKQSYEKVDKLITAVNYSLSKIEKQADRGKYRLIGHTYSALDSAVSCLRENDFFRTFILPMNQVVDQILQRAILNINKERDFYKQAQKTVEQFQDFIFSCENDIQILSPIFEAMNRSIDNFLLTELKEKAKKIKAVVIEGDGILTGREIYLSEKKGYYFKLNSRDKSAISSLHQNGIITILLSPHKKHLLHHACRDMGINLIYLNEKSRFTIINHILQKYSLEYDHIAYLIDDITNSPIPEIGLRFTVNDTSEKTKEKVDYVCDLMSGEGILHEVAQILLASE